MDTLFSINNILKEMCISHNIILLNNDTENIKKNISTFIILNKFIILNTINQRLKILTFLITDSFELFEIIYLEFLIYLNKYRINFLERDYKYHLEILDYFDILFKELIKKVPRNNSNLIDTSLAGSYGSVFFNKTDANKIVKKIEYIEHGSISFLTETIITYILTKYNMKISPEIYQFYLNNILEYFNQ